MNKLLKLSLAPKLLAFSTFMAQAALTNATELPARIEAEHFDAYFSATAGSTNGSACGTGDLTSQLTSDFDGVCDVGTTNPGEWTEYVVTSPADARYDLQLRVATSPKNVRVHVQIDGTDVSGPLTIPRTGWQRYTDVTIPIGMTAGKHTVRIVQDTGKVNFNYLKFITTWSALTADDDADGIVNANDQCPTTAPGQPVNNNGCSEWQLDDDNDQVVNADDACSATAAGDAVDASGCSIAQRDDDNDGINNSLDQCPATATGDNVDSAGCSAAQLDDDKDSINNALDACPATPTGEVIDSNGCSSSQLDDDNDGINNSLDQCPATATGDNVDNAGCSAAQLDDDKDGLNNAIDACPATPTGEAVNPDGCSETQRDDDNDGVSNDLDRCPSSSTPMVTEYGCDLAGDEDFDHIANSQDLCPFKSGLVELKGCPSSFNDFDGDGVPDAKDLCAYSIRSVVQASNDSHWQVDSNGCSMSDLHDDQDGDGISDGVDRCPLSTGYAPYDASTVKESGVSCFDREVEDDDGDGIINGLDRCELEFGHKRFNGCAFGKHADAPFDDLDQDLVNNERDHCPFSVRAPETADTPIGPNGCLTDTTYEDSDLDGVNNGKDECPHSPLGHKVDGFGCTGLQAEQRMDADQDGVNNALDLCPDSMPGDIVGPIGCEISLPDMDADGIPDTVDMCPHDVGSRLNRGCGAASSPMAEDADGDNTPLPHDRCPYSQPLQHSSSFIGSGCHGHDYADFDADGVINGLDLCPNTAKSAFVDAKGCSDYDRLDLDADGVVNGLDLCPGIPGTPRHNGCSRHHSDADEDGTLNEFDQCPYTPEFSFIENPETGCASHANEDQDGDGIRNEWDQCPSSPIAVPVDPNGCTFEQEARKHDMDNDGVGDLLDMCPGTAPLVTVDAHGCPITHSHDIDGDGVYNEFDQCENTARASAVDQRGCEISRVPVVTQNLARGFVTDPDVLHIHRDEIAFAENRYIDLTQPMEFEVGRFLLEHEVMVQTMWNGMIEVHIPPHLRNRPIVIPLRMKLMMDTQVSNWFTLTIGGSNAGSDFNNLIVNDPAILQESGITLREVFRLLAGPFAEPAAELRLFRQFWDSQRSHSTLGLPLFCEGHVNGFPIVCDRPETELVFHDDLQLAMEMDLYRLSAVVNRLDKHRRWEDCGEQRLVFGLQGASPGSKFLNIEARLPNPLPGSIAGCRPVVDFWRELATLDGASKSSAIFEFFYGGRSDMPAVISPEHFTKNSGQVRSTQFIGSDWLFKEHKIEQLCGVTSPECEYLFRAVTVKENPFGELFNPQVASSVQPWAQTAWEFQQSFVHNLGALLSPDFEKLENPVDDRFNHGQSHASGPDMAENDYLFHFGGQFGSPFGQDLWNATMGQYNADGSPLEVEQLLSRATTMTCAGCHAPDAFGLTETRRIGVLRLPNGELIDAWPRSHGFVHINEAGELSPALLNVFLPARQFQFEEMVRALQ